MKYAARWKVMINAIRIFCTGIHLNNTQTGYDFDGRLIDIRYDDERNKMHVIDWDSGEVIATFDEDGSPDYLDAWIQEPMSVEGTPTDYPLYDFD